MSRSASKKGQKKSNVKFGQSKNKVKNKFTLKEKNKKPEGTIDNQFTLLKTIKLRRHSLKKDCCHQQNYINWEINKPKKKE